MWTRITTWCLEVKLLAFLYTRHITSNYPLCTVLPFTCVWPKSLFGIDLACASWWWLHIILQLSPCSCTKDDDRQTTNVLNATACVVSNTRKFHRGLSQLLHDDLHWLDVPDQVAFKLIVTVHRCLNGRAPNYLLNHVIPVSAIVSLQRLRSAQQNTLVVPRYRLTTYGRRAFSVAGPTAWNSLPVAFRDPTISDACFRRHLKTVLFAQQRQHHSV